MRQFAKSCCLIAAWLACGPLFAEQPVTLRYKLVKGDRTFYRTTTTLKQTQTIGDLKLHNTIDQVTLSSRVVENVDTTGAAVISVKTEYLQTKVKFAQGGEFEFDTKSTKRDQSSELGKSLTPVYERLGSARVRMALSPFGEVKEVKGFEELVADVIKDNPLGAQFAGGGSNAAARFGMQEFLMVVLDEPLKPGDRWEVPSEVDLPGVANSKRKETFTLAGVEAVEGRKVAKVLISSDVSYELDRESGGAKVTGILTTSQSAGVALFDLEAGRILSLKSSVTLAGQLTVAVKNQEIPLHNEQTQTVHVELLDKLPE